MLPRIKPPTRLPRLRTSIGLEMSPQQPARLAAARWSSLMGLVNAATGIDAVSRDLFNERVSERPPSTGTLTSIRINAGTAILRMDRASSVVDAATTQ